MARFTRFGIWALVLASLTLTAAADEWKGTGAIRFDSTVARGPDFSGTVNCQPFTVTTGVDARGEQVWTMDVQVKVAEMDTDEPKRDKDMRKMMNAEAHPLVRGVAAGVPLSGLKGGTTGLGSLPFELTVAGVTVPRNAIVTNWMEADNRITFDAGFEVSLSAHGLKAPSMLFMKVSDTVKVSVHIDLER